MSEGEVVGKKRRDRVTAKVSATQLLLCSIRQDQMTSPSLVTHDKASTFITTQHDLSAKISYPPLANKSTSSPQPLPDSSHSSTASPRQLNSRAGPYPDNITEQRDRRLPTISTSAVTLDPILVCEPFI